ncbi:hypothetical protein LA080_002359 [Diaporthe eres]|nr:hypothetical protein LA080_002359 [Diaporthe eres]
MESWKQPHLVSAQRCGVTMLALHGHSKPTPTRLAAAVPLTEHEVGFGLAPTLSLHIRLVALIKKSDVGHENDLSYFHLTGSGNGTLGTLWIFACVSDDQQAVRMYWVMPPNGQRAIEDFLSAFQILTAEHDLAQLGSAWGRWGDFHGSLFLFQASGYVDACKESVSIQPRRRPIQSSNGLGSFGSGPQVKADGSAAAKGSGWATWSFVLPTATGPRAQMGIIGVLPRRDCPWLLKLCLFTYNLGDGMHPRSGQAYETYGIGVGTLNGRKKGAKPRREAHRTEQKLSPALEDSIVHWILFERRNDRPPTKGLVRQYAQHICDVSGIPTKIGHNWVGRFVSRHPEVLDSNNSGAKLRWRKGRPLQSDRRMTTARNEASVENCGEAAGGLMTVAREEHAPES